MELFEVLVAEKSGKKVNARGTSRQALASPLLELLSNCSMPIASIWLRTLRRLPLSVSEKIQFCMSRLALSNFRAKLETSIKVGN